MLMLMPETSIEKSLVIGGNCKNRGGTTNFVNIVQANANNHFLQLHARISVSTEAAYTSKTLCERQDEDHWPANPWQAQELGVGAIYWSWKDPDEFL